MDAYMKALEFQLEGKEHRKKNVGNPNHYAFNFAGALAKNRWETMPWLNAYIWLALHPKTIARKRKRVQKHRNVPDSAITPMMTCKLPSVMGRLSRACCRLMRIKTMEFE